METLSTAPALDLEIPWLTALRILEVAHVHFQEKRGIGFGELIFKYQKGECKITRVETVQGTTDCYRVQIMGSGITIMDKDKDRDSRPR